MPVNVILEGEALALPDPEIQSSVQKFTPACAATKHAKRSHLSEGQQASPPHRVHTCCRDCSKYLRSMPCSTAQSLQGSFWKAGNSRKGREQCPAVEQAAEANDMLGHSLMLKVLQSLSKYSPVVLYPSTV